MNILWLVLLACSSGQIQLDDGKSGGDDTTTDTEVTTSDTEDVGDEVTDTDGGEDATDTEVPPDTEDTEEPPPEVDYSGYYRVDLSVWIPEWSWEYCSGAGEVRVGNANGLTADIDCDISGDRDDANLTLDGSVDEDGNIVADYVLSVPDRRGYDEYDGEARGFIDGDKLVIGFEDRVQYSSDYEIDIEVSVEGSR